MNLGRKRGIVLVIVLGLVLLFVITAASFMLISNSEIKMVRRQNDSTKAFYLAEAGLQDAICRLNTSPDYYKEITSPDPITGDLSYIAYIDPPTYVAGTDTYLFDITAKGTVGDSNRKAQETAELGRSWIFSDYMLYFGGSSDMETYTFDIGKDATIIGSIFANGDLSVGKDFYIDGDVLASGSITLGVGSVVTGDLYPNSEPPGPPPVLDTTPYNAEIATAGTIEEGDISISGSISGTTYVNGTATITGNISVVEGESTATIVATGGIVIDMDQAVGDNIVLISEGTLLGQKNYAVGSDCLLYSSTLVDLNKEGGTFGSAGTGSVIITPGSVSIAKGFGFYGFVFADVEVDIAKECTVTGVIAGNGTLDMAKDATLVHDGNVADLNSVPGLTGSAWRVTALSGWREVVPAD